MSVGALAPQTFVNRIVEDLPGLRKDHQLIASLKKQLPMLMEVAPDPLLTALEHLLESGQIAPLFQDSKGDFPMLGGDSPHTYIYGPAGVKAS